MSSKYLTIIPAAALLLAAGCSNDDMDGVLADGPVAAQVTADISGGQAVSRASIDGNSASFAAGDVIHVVAGGSAYDYTLQSDGTWQAATPYYFQDFTSVTFRGWYATSTVAETETVTETDAGTESSISIDTSTQTTDATTGWNNWDILATPAVTASVLSPAINFTDGYAFQHVMSQVTFTFTAGAGVSNLEALTGYTLKSLITEAAFDTQACELAAGSTTDDITQTVSATSETTELACTPIILVPQEVTDGKLTLEVTCNGLTYVADLTLPSSATALTAGTHYTFTVSIDNTGLTIGSATIETWTTIDPQAGDASFVSTDYTLTEENGIKTYTVYTEDGLLAWAEYVLDGNYAANCTLAADITLTIPAEGKSNWTVIGTSSTAYAGTFDGNGYTIENLTINASSDYQGLIGYLGSEGVVKNLSLENVNISSTGSYTGAVAGRIDGGTVINCSVSGSVSSDSTTGGVVGFNQYGSVIACYSTATVSGTWYNTGGVVGRNRYGSTVTACYATGEVSGPNYIGGVVGRDDSGTVTACYWNNNASYGLGYSNSNIGAAYVNGTSAWASAASSMNTALAENPMAWQYVVNDAYDGTDTTVAPLLLKEVTE